MSELPISELLGNIDLPNGIKKLTYPQLEQLAMETRKVIIDAVSKTGGHLAPSLGVVELTIALLRMCDPLEDRIIWDVSHQSYPFKVLTDRYDRIHTMRTYKGISGFTKPSESPYDAFGTGHSSTSISAGLGMVCANEILNKERKVVAVIGDGAMTGGMAFEGLNNLGNLQKPMVVILNDNEMSINANVGALSTQLSKLATGELASSVRTDVEKIVRSLPIKGIKSIAGKVEDMLVSLFTTGSFFEELGLRYIGPVNGHNIRDIERALGSAFAYNGPVLMHVVTKKGKGYIPSEINPSRFHGVGQFDVETGDSLGGSSGGRTWTEIFGAKLVSMAERDSRIVGITAAMKDGTGLCEFADKFPDRFFDTGIAEQHALTFASGLAISGLRPYVALYSTFLQRGFDQVIHDIALQELPVRICIDRAGLVGQDGPTHHGAFDLSFLRIIPNISIFLPRDLLELEQMLDMSLDWEGAVAIRYARGVCEESADIPREPMNPNKPELVYHDKSNKVVIVSAGHIFSEAHKFWQKLTSEGIKASLINLRFVNSIDKDVMMELLSGKQVYTFEENVRAGGVGEMLETMLIDSRKKTEFNIFSLPNSFVTQGTIKELREECGLTATKAWEYYLLKSGK